MESAVHRLESPIADPAKQLPVISKARAPPPGRLGRLPRRPMIPPAGSAHSAHSDPFPMAPVPKRLQGPKPYNPKETQSDLGEYGKSLIPYLAEPLFGPHKHAPAQSEVQRLEELERYQHSEGGQVVEAAEHENFHVETKEVILRSAITRLEALVHGGAGEELRQDELVQMLLNRYKEQGQDQAPTDSGSRPSELARGSSEAAPTATPAADAPMQHQDPASRSSEPAGGGSGGEPQDPASRSSEPAGAKILPAAAQSLPADASMHQQEPASGGPEPADGGSGGENEAAPTATPAADASMENPPQPRQVPTSAFGGSPAREALTSIAEEEQVGEHGQGCSGFDRFDFESEREVTPRSLLGY